MFHRNTDLLSSATPEEPISCDDEGADPTVPSLARKRGRQETVTTGSPGLLEMDPCAESSDAQLPGDVPLSSGMTVGMASHTVTPASNQSEPHQLRSPLRSPPRCLPEPSDAAEDSSAYAETLEGGSGSGSGGGVPFYPGMTPQSRHYRWCLVRQHDPLIGRIQR